MNKLTCAIFCWPSFGHIPLLCFLERLLCLTCGEKIVDLYLGGLACIKENSIIFFNKFQRVSNLSKHLHLQHQWRVWPRRTGRNSLIYATWKKASIAIMFVARLLHQGQPLKCWQTIRLGHPLREMEQQKLFSGCLLRTHSWPAIGFSSSLTRISETNDFGLPVFPCRLSGLQWHILILEARKRSLIKHSDGSAKHEAIMKLQHSHVVLAGGCSV